MINKKVNLLKQLLQDKEKEILKDLLSNVLNFEIKNIKYDKNIQLSDISEYEFELVKAIITLETEEIEIYLRVVKNSKIKESIFCYWCSIYEEEMQKLQIKENIINKVLISELTKTKYKQSIFLEIENNKVPILETGTEVIFFEIDKYINEYKNDINKYQELNKYFKENAEDDVLLIGIKTNKNKK